MSTIIKIYPYNNVDCSEYFRNGGLTTDDNGEIAYAGLTGTPNEYIWPLDFNLSAHADKIMRSLTFYAKRRDSGSNSVSPSRLIGADLATVKTYTGCTSGRTDLGNDHSLVDGDSFQSWNISGAWNTLKAGLAYIVLSGNADSYTVFHTNDQVYVTLANRPYIELEYDEGVVHAKHDGTFQKCLVHYKYGGSFHRCKPHYKSGDVFHNLG